MAYATMTPVAALDTVVVADLNDLKTNVDKRTGLYTYVYETTGNLSTTSTTHVNMDGTNLAVSPSGLEAQNLLITFMGYGTIGVVSRYAIFVDSVKVTEHYLNAGTWKPIALCASVVATTGCTIEVRYKTDTGSSITVYTGAVLTVRGF